MRIPTTVRALRRWVEKWNIPFSLDYDPAAPIDEKWGICWPDGCRGHTNLQGGQGKTIRDAIADTKYTKIEDRD